MRIICMSDLHGYLPKLEESGELLLICGDIIPLNIQFNMPSSKSWFETKFTEWANKLDFKKFIFIGGNHDAYIERNKEDFYKLFPKEGKVTYLCNDLFEYVSDEGIVYKIFGTPYCHIFGKWPFMREDEILKEKFSEIPENLDILITHDPPRLGDVDTILQEGHWSQGTICGGEVLATEVLEKKPKYVVCGHIHSGSHVINNVGDTKLVNVSLLNEHYNITYKPLILDI